MAKLTVTAAELQRAQAAAQYTQEALVDGVDGAEQLDPIVTLANFEGLDAGALVKAGIRRTAYALLRAIAVKPQPYVPVPADFSNNWTHLGGSFNTRLMCWIDWQGMKRIAGGIYRSSGSAVNGELVVTLPVGFEPLDGENGKVLLAATNTGVGRFDLFGRQLTYRTTGGYTTGYGYAFFDNVPGWR